MMRSLWIVAGLAGTLLFAVGCDRQVGTGVPKALDAERAVMGPAPPTAKEQNVAAAPAKPEEKAPLLTPETFHDRLAKANSSYNGSGQFKAEGEQITTVVLQQSGVSDLTPLAGLPLQALDVMNTPVRELDPLQGMPLQVLYLEGTRVRDLRPLAGMPLRSLYLSKTPVTDLSPLQGIPLVELNLVDTEVSDLSPLSGMPLNMLWLNDSPVADIAPLAGTPIVSLTLKGTKVSDISPVTRMPRLERLHIAETPVVDLSPLAGLRLTRLVLSPQRIRKGMDAVRAMPTLREIGTEFGEGPNTLMHPNQFWQLYDQGKLSQ